MRIEETKVNRPAMSMKDVDLGDVFQFALPDTHGDGMYLRGSDEDSDPTFIDLSNGDVWPIDGDNEDHQVYVVPAVLKVEA